MHIFVVRNDHRVYLQTLSNIACQCTKLAYWLSLGGSAIISRASPNSTITSSINLAGSTTMNERCSGMQYNDPYIHISIWNLGYGGCVSPLKSSETSIERTSSQLILLSGQRCDAAREECLYSENGQTFWLIVFQNSQFD